jgi:predicted RNA methylase
MQEIRHGDCLAVMREMQDASVDAVVTDPPYGLAFMGKRWDYDVPSEDVWRECLRVLKPGGHLLAFAGTRTQHRMAVRIEDAGFEIRDMIAWVYGSGFPKSLDVSKAIDKRKDWSLVERLAGEIRRARTEAGLSLAEIGEATMAATAGTYGKWYHRGGHMFFETGRSLPSRPEWDRLSHVLPIAPEFTAVYDEAERIVLSNTASNRNGGTWADQVGSGMFQAGERSIKVTAPATPAAKTWQGWGTALKPALEPITVARKPLIGTVAENVLAHGTGALNVDGCRIEGRERTDYGLANATRSAGNTYGTPSVSADFDATQGRWPANLIHDGSEEVVGLLNDAARFFYCAKASAKDRDEGVAGVAGVAGGMSGRRDGSMGSITMRKNTHPTVKPTDLMRYLCRLVTPPGGTVLDPFAGSGSTGKAAALEGFRFIGIEREAEYVEIARARIAAAVARASLFERTAS